MHVRLKSVPPKASSASRRRLGAIACLLAFAVALFGHSEASVAVAFEQNSSMVMLSEVDDQTGHATAALPTHCAFHGHCSLQALLPQPQPDSAGSARPIGASPDQRASGRIPSPQHHPPKTKLFE